MTCHLSLHSIKAWLMGSGWKTNNVLSFSLLPPHFSLHDLSYLYYRYLKIHQHY